MFRKIIALTAALILPISIFTSCDSKSNDPPAPDNNEAVSRSLVLCIQRTANSAEPMLNDSTVSDTVYNTVRSSGDVTVIEVDGNSYTVDSISADIPEHVSDSKKDSIAADITKHVLAISESATPKTGEVDVLKGLISSARNLDPSCDEKTVLYLGSALQTTGYLPFATHNLFDTDTDVIISQLKKKKAIPEFPEGTTVFFAGLGDTIAPQKDLAYAQIAKLKEIMKKICEEGGAKVEFITSTPVSDINVSDFPPVSTVTVYNDFVDTAIPGTIKIDETQISFEPDSYELSNKAAAIEFFNPYVDSINVSDDTVFVCGTTATAGSVESCRAFSLKRAQTIVNLLIEIGVDSSKLAAKGLGYDNNFHIIDTDENGNLIEEAAQRNRLVLIIPSSSNDALKI